jgi:hypothetical protein
MLQVTNYAELPLTISVEQFAGLIGVSRSLAYAIVKEEKLALRVGVKRLVVPRDRLIRYLQDA